MSLHNTQQHTPDVYSIDNHCSLPSMNQYAKMLDSFTNQENNISKAKSFLNLPNNDALNLDFDETKCPIGLFGTQDEHSKSHYNVSIERPFYISNIPITQKTWVALGFTNHSKNIGNHLPVERITWVEAIIFCNQLSLIKDLTPCYHFKKDCIFFDAHANGYRLPFELEWEYAAKANTKSIYSSTSDYYEIYPSYHPNKPRTTHDVKLNKPNAWGIYDMTGNVNEWCNDIYSVDMNDKILKDASKNSNVFQFDIFEKTFSIMDLKKDITDLTLESMVIKGGSWYNSPSFSKISTKHMQNALHPSSMIGFRVARTII